MTGALFVLTLIPWSEAEVEIFLFTCNKTQQYCAGRGCYSYMLQMPLFSPWQLGAPAVAAAKLVNYSLYKMIHLRAGEIRT